MAILLIIVLLYFIYHLIQPSSEGFALIQTPNQKYAIPQLKGVIGRYIRILPALPSVNPKTDGYLTISQIQVFDINGSNVSLKKPVKATSTGGSPVDKKYGKEVLTGNVYLFKPGVSDSVECIVDGTTVPRDTLVNVFETSVQNACGEASENCDPVITSDTQYVEIDLTSNVIINRVIYTGRGDGETRMIQTIDGSFDFLTQIDRVKGMRVEIYDAQRMLTYSTTLPTTEIVQTINIPSNLYGVNMDSAGSASGPTVPMTSVQIPNLESFNAFIKPFQAYPQAFSQVRLPRLEDKTKSPVTLAYVDMLSSMKEKIYSTADIDLSNNIFIPLLTDSPLNFYYDIYKQSGCNPVCVSSTTDGAKHCVIPTACTTVTVPATTVTLPFGNTVTVPATTTTQCPPTYCKPGDATIPAITETIPVNVFGTASPTAIQEMNDSIEYCKLLYLGSPAAIENFIRVNFSYSNPDMLMKAYLRSSTGSSARGSRSFDVADAPAAFCVPDVVQKFRNGSFVTSFSAANNAWNSVNCTRELTPAILGLIPFVSRNFIVQWVSNRIIRYKHFINMLSNNIQYALEDLNDARKDLDAAEEWIKHEANPLNFTPVEIGIVLGSAVLPLVPGLQALSGIFNPVNITLAIIATKSLGAVAKRDKVRGTVNTIEATYNEIVAQGAITGGAITQLPEVSVPMMIPTYLSINSKSVLDTIAQQFYELMGGQFNMAHIYDVLPLGSTMIDMRFDLYIHDSYAAVNAPINDLKAQYNRIKSAKEVSQDILDQAQIDYEERLSALEETSIESQASPFQGALARLFYVKSANSFTITGIIFDDRAVTSFIPELNGGIPVALGSQPGNINYSPNVVFTKNQTESLNCRDPVVLRRIFDDYINLMNDSDTYPLAKANPPLDLTKGILYIDKVVGATQLSPTSCNLSWIEVLYDSNTNIPISDPIVRSAKFQYTSDTGTWYSSELTIDRNGVTILSSSMGITSINPPVIFTKPLPARSNLDNLSEICPTTSCEDSEILYSLVDQYNSDPTLAGTILTVTHAYTPNPNQCDLKVSINYDSQITSTAGNENMDPTTGLMITTYNTVKKGAVSYAAGESGGEAIETPVEMTLTGVKKDITIALYVATDPTTCEIILSDASGENTGTSIQSNTPALFTPMIYANEVTKRKTGPLGSSISQLQNDYTRAIGSTKKALKSYRIKEYNSLNPIFSTKGISGACASKPCSDFGIMQIMKDYYQTNIAKNNGIVISSFSNIAQTGPNICEASIVTNARTLAAYKFIFSTEACTITGATPLLITGPTDDQILDITKEMNAMVKETFTSYTPTRRVETQAIGVRGFGLDHLRNSEHLKDTQFELPLVQQEPERKPHYAPPSYRFLRFIPTAIRGSGTVNVGKFTFFYEDQPLLLKGSVTNPMGTWEGTVADVTGPGRRPGWSDAHKKPLVFAFRDPIAVDAYSFTTAAPEVGIEGDPISWKLEGSANGTFWTTIDTQVNFPTPVRRLAEIEKLYLN